MLFCYKFIGFCISFLNNFNPCNREVWSFVQMKCFLAEFLNFITCIWQGLDNFFIIFHLSKCWIHKSVKVSNNLWSFYIKCRFIWPNLYLLTCNMKIVTLYIYYISSIRFINNFYYLECRIILNFNFSINIRWNQRQSSWWKHENKEHLWQL